MAVVYLHSRAIAWVDYDAPTQRLRIKFKSGHQVHDYRWVPQHVYEAFMAAPSHRIFHDLHIKDRYDC